VNFRSGSLGAARANAGRWHSSGGSLSCARRGPACYELRGAHPAAGEKSGTPRPFIGSCTGPALELRSWRQSLTGSAKHGPCALALVAVVLLVRNGSDGGSSRSTVTNRRVIYKKGFIWRRTNETNMDEVESEQVNQSILGRMLDYGTVTILGTGEGFETVRTIAGPIKLRTASPEPDWPEFMLGGGAFQHSIDLLLWAQCAVAHHTGATID
jgi:PH (Pleckstrin Homology) domain-containing protein